MRRTAFGFVIAAFSCLLAPMAGQAEPTEITVRVISKDAKFIGSSIGGMRVTLRDGHTGEVLATGITSGGTGNTGLVMHNEGGRRARLADETAAGFKTVLDLEEPRLIEVEAYGPLAQPQAAHRVSSSQWVVPGRHLSAGDGWVLELPGFVVDVLTPPAAIKLSAATRQLELRANVIMMCGCPIKPEGLWDANGYEVKAIVRRNGELVRRLDLSYAGETSQFAGSLPIEAPGTYDVVVYAYDPANGNTGLDRTTFTVTK